MVFQAARRIAQLDAAHEGLVFGRLDLRPELDPRAALHRPDRAARRAPRLAADRLARARRPPCSTRPPRPSRTTSYAAGCCAAPGRRSSASRTSCSTPTPPTSRALPIVGEGALMAQLSRARDRSMHSIVATIQAEQDQAIRAPGQGRRRRSAAARAPARPWSRCTARRTCSTPTAAATRRGGVLVVGPQRRLHALHRAGAAVASARPRSRCARWARSSTACGRPATTSRRSPTSRARPGWPS